MKVLRSIITVSVIDGGQMKTFNALPLTEYANRCNRTRNHITKLINEGRLTKVHLFESDLARQPVMVLLDQLSEKEQDNFKRIDELKNKKINE